MTDHLDNARTNATDLYMSLVSLKAQLPRVPEGKVHRIGRLLEDALRSARVCVHTLSALEETLLRDVSPSEVETKPMRSDEGKT